VTQPALSQTINGLERELRLKLLDRSSTGTRPSEAGRTLFEEAQAVLARYRQAERAMARLTSGGSGVLRLGIPLEFPFDVLQPALAELGEACPDTKVQVRHLSTAQQIAALRADELEVGLLRERPSGEDFDAILITREELGVLLCTQYAAELAGPDGVALDALGGMDTATFRAYRTSRPAC
jgi:DNA-binding transcriptional LysR family regulator